MKPRNFVAKHMNTFNRAQTHRDRTKYNKRDQSWRDEYAEDLEFLKFKSEEAHISGKAYISFFNRGKYMSKKINMMTLTKMFFADTHPDDELVKINTISQAANSVSIYYRRNGKALHANICKADMVLWLVQQ